MFSSLRVKINIENANNKPCRRNSKSQRVAISQRCRTTGQQLRDPALTS
jgi:hypothetical protein